MKLSKKEIDALVAKGGELGPKAKEPVTENGRPKKDWNRDGYPKAKAKAEARIAKRKGEQLFEKACEAHGLPVPVSEYEFHPTRKWRFDWLFDGWLALEIEGGIFGVGKPCPTCNRRPAASHSGIDNIKRDIEKYNEAAMMGFVVLRCLPEDVKSGAAFALVKRALAAEMEQP